MKRLFKLILFLIFVMAIALGLLLAIGQFLFGDMPSCDEDSEAVAYARSLPQDRLARLYQDIKSFAGEERTFYWVEPASDSAPPELSDLKYRNILLVENYRSRIMIEGCLYHYVILDFKGIYDEKPGAIILSWGERPWYGKQKLWPVL